MRAGSASVATSRAAKPRKVTARAEDLDAYMERLYDEDVESKLEGAKMILQLAEFAGNIESLVQNEALMARLAWCGRLNALLGTDLVSAHVCCSACSRECSTTTIRRVRTSRWP